DRGRTVRAVEQVECDAVGPVAVRLDATHHRGVNLAAGAAQYVGVDPVPTVVRRVLPTATGEACQPFMPSEQRGDGLFESGPPPLPDHVESVGLHVTVQGDDRDAALAEGAQSVDVVVGERMALNHRAVGAASGEELLPVLVDQ